MQVIGFVWTAGIEGDDEAHDGCYACAVDVEILVVSLSTFEAMMIRYEEDVRSYNKPTANIAKTPIFRLVGILSFDMR